MKYHQRVVFISKSGEHKFQHFFEGFTEDKLKEICDKSIRALETKYGEPFTWKYEIQQPNNCRPQ